MCDSCGCRAHDAIANLSVEHETLLGMLSELLHHVDTHDVAAAKPLLEQLHDALTPHALREEHGVVAELEHAGIDHTYIDMFQQDHIAREASDLFPAAHQLLVPGQWDAVDLLTDPSLSRT